MIQWHLIRRHRNIYFLLRKINTAVNSFPPQLSNLVLNYSHYHYWFPALLFLRFSFSLEIMFLPSLSLTLNEKSWEKNPKNALKKPKKLPITCKKLEDTKVQISVQSVSDTDLVEKGKKNWKESATCRKFSCPWWSHPTAWWTRGICWHQRKEGYL